MATTTMANSVSTKLSQLLKGLGFNVKECDSTNDAVDTRPQDWDAWLLARHFRKTNSPYCLRSRWVGRGRTEVRFDLYRSGRAVYSFREYDVFPEEENRPWDVLEHASRRDVITYLDKVRDYVEKKFGVAEYSLAESVVCSILTREGNGTLLEIIPSNLRTKKVCEAAVSEDGHAIEFVPEEFCSSTLCDMAVSENGWAILDIPETARTKNLWMKAARADCLGDDHPVLHMGRPDKAVLKEALDWGQTGILWKIQSDPKYHGIVDELIDYAVEQRSYALDDVSYKNMTRERCETAVRLFGDEALDFIPESLQVKYSL